MDGRMDERLTDDLATLGADALEPLFWPPTRLGVDSAWLGHVPFGHWLVSTQRPANIVELGTRSGVSFSAFCEAAIRCKLDTRALAFAPQNPDATEASSGLKEFLDQRYASVSTLLRSTADEALDHVPDASVDLLHVNHVCQHEDISRIFSDWLPKLSRRAMVLIHATNPREGDHVRRFWKNISPGYPHFQFLHGEGLGMLAVGEAAHGAVREICELRDDGAAMLRHRFAVLGRQWASLNDLERVTCVSAELRMEATRLHADLAARDAQIATHTTQSSAHAIQSACLTTEISRLQSCVETAQAELNELSQEIIAFEHERETFLKSTSWRITAPLRRLAGKTDIAKRKSIIKPFHQDQRRLVRSTGFDRLSVLSNIRTAGAGISTALVHPRTPSFRTEDI